MNKKNFNKIENINIIGGSIFGILLALSLRKEKEFDKTKIKIYERNNSILSSWQNICLFNKKVNKGFFGIEIPRANQFVDLLSNEFIEKNFNSIPNYKLLLIEKDLVPYQYQPSQLPEIYKDEMSLFLESGLEIDDFLKTSKNKNLKFFNLIKNCSERYSDLVEDSIHMFSPWFFPESKFENIKNISSQSNITKPSTYLIPKKGVFSELISDVEEILLKNKIDLQKNFSLNLNNVKEENSQNLFIWATSSIPLLKMYKPETLKKIQVNKRYCGISIFNLSTKALNSWRKEFKYVPSEILTMSTLCPNVSRISFTDNLETAKNSFLLIEINSKTEEFINKLDISLIESWLSEVFDTPVKYKDSTSLFSSYNPSFKTYELMNNELKAIQCRIPVKVPFSYWWPINTSRAVNAAISIKNDLINRDKS